VYGQPGKWDAEECHRTFSPNREFVMAMVSGDLYTCIHPYIPEGLMLALSLQLLCRYIRAVKGETRVRKLFDLQSIAAERNLNVNGVTRHVSSRIVCYSCA
jgi:hypothetical protein